MGRRMVPEVAGVISFSEATRGVVWRPRDPVGEDSPTTISEM